MITILRALAFLLFVSSCICENCWFDNQATHKISDLKQDNEAFKYFTFDIEQGVPGKVLLFKR